MKKLILFFAALFVFGNSFAQTTIPNGGFETWGGNGLFTQEQPNNWTAALEGTVTIYGSYGLPVHFYFGTKSSDAHSGNYALKLVSQSIGITGMPSSLKSINRAAQSSDALLKKVFSQVPVFTTLDGLKPVVL